MFISVVLPAMLAAAISASRCLRNPYLYEFRVGNIRGTIVGDGPIILPQDLFLVAKEAVRRSYKASFRQPFPFIWQQNIAVLDTSAGRVMVDAGSFNIPEFIQADQGGRLLPNLRAAGIDPASIDAILLTHAHPDHVSGISTKDGKKSFPNAKVYISKADHLFWMTDPIPNPNPNLANETTAIVGDIYRRSIKPYGRDIVLVNPNAEPIIGFKFIPVIGHSPGHSAIEVSSQGNRLIITGDSWVSKPDQLQHPEWGWFFEIDSELAFKSRIKLLSRLAKRRDLVLAYHEDFPGLGFIRKDGDSFDWVPAPAANLEIVEKKC